MIARSSRAARARRASARPRAGRGRRRETPPAGPDAGPIPRRLPLLLRRAWFGLNQAFRRRIAPLGLTPDQYTALRTLAEQEPVGLTQRELTEHMASDPNTVAALVERMERAGLIERKPHERDGRANRIELAAAGRERFARARTEAQALQAEIMAALPVEGQEAFLSGLACVAEACQAASERVPSPPAARAVRRRSSP